MNGSSYLVCLSLLIRMVVCAVMCCCCLCALYVRARSAKAGNLVQQIAYAGLPQRLQVWFCVGRPHSGHLVMVFGDMVNVVRPST